MKKHVSVFLLFLVNIPRDKPKLCFYDLADFVRFLLEHLFQSQDIRPLWDLHPPCECPQSKKTRKLFGSRSEPNRVLNERHNATEATKGGSISLVYPGVSKYIWRRTRTSVSSAVEHCISNRYSTSFSLSASEIIARVRCQMSIGSSCAQGVLSEIISPTGPFTRPRGDPTYNRVATSRSGARDHDIEGILLPSTLVLFPPLTQKVPSLGLNCSKDVLPPPLTVIISVLTPGTPGVCGLSPVGRPLERLLRASILSPLLRYLRT